MFRGYLNRRVLSGILLVILLFVMISLTAHRQRSINPLEGVVVDVFSLLQKPFQRVASAFTGFADQIRQVRTLKDDFAELERQLDQLKREYEKLQEQKIENQILRELLSFKESSPYPSITATVVGRSATYWYGTVVLDKGTRDGVKADMPVVTGKGLVGRIISTTDRTSTLLLLMDPDSGVGGLIQRTRDYGVVLGQPAADNILEMRLFSRESQVAQGDQVFTSGLGEVYPKGLPIGAVKDVVTREYGLTTYALVEPFVDFDRLEYVLILMTSGEEAGR